MMLYAGGKKKNHFFLIFKLKLCPYLVLNTSIAHIRRTF